MHIKSKLSCILGLITLLSMPTLHADSSNSPLEAIAMAIKKVAFSPSSTTSAKESLPDRIASDQGVLVFAAPPRETSEQGKEIYQPIAEYLSKVIGKKIVYKYPGTWGVYRTEMLKGSYDLIFDGPHFNSYRMEKLNHNILVKIPERHEFAVIVRKEQKFSALSQMAGYTFCTHAPPNLGTLVLLSQFDNPARQPFIVNNLGWTKVYEGLALKKKCVAAILPMANLEKFANSENLVHVLYKTKALPNQAFSAGPRTSPEDRAEIAAALISQEGA